MLSVESGIVIFLWLLWCFLHSLLISRTVIKTVQARLPKIMPWYRIGYNLFSLITILPVVMYTRSLPGDPVFIWDGWMILLRMVLLLMAFWLFWGGARQYDMDVFLGLRQLGDKSWHATLGHGDDFVRSGVFGLTRHPWYLGSLCFIWSAFASYPPALFWAVSVLSLYLFIGTNLEEKKILQLYPKAYEEYRQQVSILFPWKWILRKLWIKNSR